MSTKFEELLDLLINEEHEKANELFHEIVVEKSRSIYENLIAEEEDEEADDRASAGARGARRRPPCRPPMSRGLGLAA